jgi:hypothetical protein
MKKYCNGKWSNNEMVSAWTGEKLEINDIVQVDGGVGIIQQISTRNTALAVASDYIVVKLLVKFKVNDYPDYPTTVRRNYTVKSNDFVRKLSNEELLQLQMEQ